jgi:hypothetical protein
MLWMPSPRRARAHGQARRPAAQDQHVAGAGHGCKRPSAIARPARCNKKPWQRPIMQRGAPLQAAEVTGRQRAFEAAAISPRVTQLAMADDVAAGLGHVVARPFFGEVGDRRPDRLAPRARVAEGLGETAADHWRAMPSAAVRPVERMPPR